MSGGFNPISMISQVALAAATGGTSLIASMAMQIVEQVAKQVIQQVGQQLGLPQSAISGALGAFDAATGNVGGAAQDFAGAAGALGGSIGQAIANFSQASHSSPVQQAQISNDANNAVDNSTQRVMQQLQNGSMDATSGASDGKDSFLVAFAKALGKSMDAKMSKMMDISAKIDKATQSANADNKNPVTGQLSAELQGLGQEVSILSNAIANSIKSIGEAESTLARKG